MNKYQEALDFFLEIANSNEKLLINQEWLEKYSRYLQQLVDKEKPKELLHKTFNDKVFGKVTEYYCPNCKVALEIWTNTHFNYNDKYCRFCGQKLEVEE